MPYWNHGFGWGWFGLLMVIGTMVLFWCGLGTIVFVLARRSGRVGAGPTRDADKILDERFAHGEIDDEELERCRDVLHNRH
ncbi:MAG: SHOCT domain-containing protein [Actinophytocola sp.]|uniref:SHOCT domain-containing protein n=1 Tax=Actinophytocola sp. TaxID=1872138 RepID=UPI00132323B1|nr:SHOCT domain-containing protein [Actinophytocola sp.]MPZ81735.1 SHOCT domain-containing protein [Actinophytocola sp.]